MASPNSTRNTFIVALLLCLVCSTMVSTVAVFLKDKQASNRKLDRKRNILRCAGLIEKDAPAEKVRAEFEKLEPVVVELGTGKIVEDIDPANYKQRKAAKKPETSTKIPKEMDPNNIGRRANYAVVYLAKKDGKISQVILPVHGRGLWSTLYGFLALEEDTKTVAGFAYYEHGETPGLGGEVDNPNWKEQWIGKKVYDESWEPAIKVIKGQVDPEQKNAEHFIDGLAGATITSKGVSQSMRYWLSDHAFGPFLAKLRTDKGVE